MKTKITAIIGGAGTGKSTRMMRELQDDARQFRLTATTGIAAINMSNGLNGEGGVVTLNSELKYFDTTSMEEAYSKGKLHQAIRKVRSKAKSLAIDEISMMNAKQFSLLVRCMDEVNATKDMEARGGIGLTVVGDFCQLSPVPDKNYGLNHPTNKFAFECTEWERVEIEKLTKVFRQTDEEFMQALYAARRGDGGMSGEILERLGCFTQAYDPHYDGVTILPINKEVDKLNYIRLQELLDNGAKKISWSSFRWGWQRGEWTQNIPQILDVAEGAYVMIYVNDWEKDQTTGEMRYANGSTGYVVEGDEYSVLVRLRDTDKLVRINKVTRAVYEKSNGYEIPEEIDSYEQFKGSPSNDEYPEREIKKRYRDFLIEMTKQHRTKPNEPYFDYEQGKWVMGEITYMPLRLAYASTVHKTQGLTLDRVQVNPTNRFFEMPAMAYVAISRVRDYRQLRIVGNRELWEKRCNASAEVMEWI